MTQDTGYRRWSLAVLLSVALAATSAAVAAGESAGGAAYSAAVIVVHPGNAEPRRLAPGRSDCRRHGVIWSGGTALRQPVRISPRPVRSRWQGAEAGRIRCGGGDAFRQSRVAEQPWIR